MIFTDLVNKEIDTDELFNLSDRYDMLTLHAELFIVIGIVVCFPGNATNNYWVLGLILELFAFSPCGDTIIHYTIISTQLRMLSSLSCNPSLGFFIVIPFPAVFCMSTVSVFSTGL
jgi:hypothetical protein